MSGQSTPARGSFHVSPIPSGTPKNSSKIVLYDQHTLARACETLAMTQKQQAPTSPRRCRPTHGHVTIKTRTAQETGFAALLCIQENLFFALAGKRKNIEKNEKKQSGTLGKTAHLACTIRKFAFAALEKVGCR
jgi:hypothetical protein